MIRFAAMIASHALDYAHVRALTATGPLPACPDEQITMVLVSGGTALVEDDQGHWPLGSDDLFIHIGHGRIELVPREPGTRLLLVAGGWSRPLLRDEFERHSLVVPAAADTDGSRLMLCEALSTARLWTGRAGEHGRAKLATALLITALGQLHDLARVDRNLDPRIAHLLSAIHKAPGHAWTLRNMAEVAGLRRSAFIEMFKRQTGVPPACYVREIRLQKAAQLIWDEEASVKAAALQIGFNSVPSFTSAFRERFGVTPGRSASLRPD